MPKLKSHKGAAKRFRVTKKGKVTHQQAYKSHLLTKKNKSRKRNLKKIVTLDTVEVKKIKEMLPYK
ncbi:MAG: 50S ribosomal protein L35 [Candidatus Fischerbacteria bacterium RBG_13_37_8]|uniref:Large ribosomal subunit protein bL35 n=1 Tax=Candidatus Fischerbacteria bacterium RBG_13_37_8 TaxID=1817863 RepID=A0A1F5VPE9_9BACT|nr:MAG: 50S ribosomal protein L35 [Candidatus Fischerbacteria bacterium RBG_13_37_8]